MKRDLKVFLTLIFSLLAFSQLTVSQEDAERLTKDAFKWFPEGNYTNVTVMDLPPSIKEEELDLLKLYWKPYPSYDPFDTFLPESFQGFSFKATGKVARFKIRKPTAKGRKIIKENYGNGGTQEEFGGENYFIRNEGFEIIVCHYDDPSILISEALKNKQILKHSESFFDLDAYVYTDKKAEKPKERYFCAPGTGEILIADNPQVLALMLDAGYGAGSFAESEQGLWLLEHTDAIGVYWMFDDFETVTRVKLDVARKAGDDAKIKQFQGYLDHANDLFIRYFRFNKDHLRKGYLTRFPTPERTREVYLKYKEVEGVDPKKLPADARKKNFHLSHPDMKNEIKGAFLNRYRDMDKKQLLQRIKETEGLIKERQKEKEK